MRVLDTTVMNVLMLQNLRVLQLTITDQSMKGLCFHVTSNVCIIQLLKSTQKEIHLGIRYTCDDCDFESSRKENLKFHIDYRHNLIEKYLCDQCEFSAIAKKYVKTHKMNMHETKIISCKDCTFETNKYTQYKKHRIESHSGPKLMCEECDFVTFKKYKLEDHRNAIHMQFQILIQNSS